jgi:polyribonucleotide 5'-hydroxyl-kinase
MSSTIYQNCTDMPKLETGTAELFGTELVINGTYTFTGTKAAIYTWHGCTFTVTGDVLASEYTAEETPMTEYANVHFALENLRSQNRQQNRSGPRVLILGPENAGKSSLAKMLTGYAIRGARVPVVVNLDPKEGVMSIPGTLTATAFKTLMDVESVDGWGSSPMSGPSAVPVKLPLVYYHGLPDAADNEGANYKALVSRLALAVTGRLQDDGEAREAGVIIDTPGSIASGKGGATGYDLISHIVSEFAVSNIVVLGSERLYSDMTKRFDGKPVSSSLVGETMAVIKLPKSGGCVDRDGTFMKSLRAAQVKAYFFGTPDLSNGVALSPRQQQVEWRQLSVWRLKGWDREGGTGLTFLPGGLEEEDEIGKPPSAGAGKFLERMSQPVAAMRSCVLAVVNADAEATEEEEIRDSSVMGFLYVVDVDEARGRTNLLAPVAGRIPNRAIVWGAWPEEVIGMV